MVSVPSSMRLDAAATKQEDEDWQAWCRKNGLCPICGQTKTHKRQFQMFGKKKWSPLTVAGSKPGDFKIYEGYCLKQGCYTLEQAKKAIASGQDPSSPPSARAEEPAAAAPKRKRFRDILKSKNKNGGAPHVSSSSGSLRGSGSGMSSSLNSSGSSLGGSQQKNRLANYSAVSSSSIRRMKHSSGSSVTSAGPIRISDDDVSVGSSSTMMTTKSTARRGLHQLLQEHAGTILDLSSTRLHHVHVTELVGSLAHASTLHTLILENCRLNDNQVECLAQGLNQHMPPALKRLSLRSNSWGNRGALALAPWLERNEILEELDVAKNSMGSRGASAILAALRKPPVTPVRLLNMAHNEIWDADDARGSFFATTKTLEIFNIEGNFIHDEGVAAIARGIKSNPHPTKIQGLYLGWNGIGDEGMTELAKCLETNKSLLSLGLGENDITSAGARELLNAMHINTTLREITGLYHNLIDRKFLIVSIKRLLQSHREQQQASATGSALPDIVEEDINDDEPLLEPVRDDLEAPQEMSSASLVWEDKLYAPSEQQKAPLLEINFEPSEEEKQEQYPSKVADMDKSSMPVREIYEPPPDVVAQHRAPPAAPVQTKPKFPFTYDQATLLQAVPLARLDRQSAQYVPVPMWDVDYEKHIFMESIQHEAEKYEARMDVDMKAATMEALESFFASPSKGILHLSCAFDSSGSMLLENGLGVVLPITPADFKRLAGYQSSRSRPKLLVICAPEATTWITADWVRESKMSHVVSVDRDETFRDAAVSKFCRSFYRTLVQPQEASTTSPTMSTCTLQQAFESACEAVRVEGISKRQDKFRLWPVAIATEGSGIDATELHELPITFCHDVSKDENLPQQVQSLQRSMQWLPSVPSHFVGREVEMYELLETLRGTGEEEEPSVLVRLTGPKGSGKKSLAAALARHVASRQAWIWGGSPSSGDSAGGVFWLPPPTPKSKSHKIPPPDPDSLYGDLCQAISWIQTRGETLWDEDHDAAMECRDRIDLELMEESSSSPPPLLIVDTRQFKTKAASQNLESFLNHLVNLDDVKIKVLLITEEEKQGGKSAPASVAAKKLDEEEDDTYLLGPLSFRASSLLFGDVSRFITLTGCPAAQTPDELAALLLPPSVAARQATDSLEFFSRRRLQLYQLLGNGLPASIIKTAKEMPPKEFIELITVANYPEYHVESYGALEKEVKRWTFERELAIRTKNYLRATDIVQLLEELEGLRSKFSSVQDLEQQEVRLKEDFRKAIASRQYDQSNALKKEILAVKRKIMQERRARPEAAAENAADILKEFQKQIDNIMEEYTGEQDLDSTGVSGTFLLRSGFHDCELTIYNGAVVDFDPSPEVGSVVCWTNECCDITIDEAGKKLIEYGGPHVKADIESLPPISETQWGNAKCGTGNAVIVGPGHYNNLRVPCVLLAVAPLPSSRNMECKLEDQDRLHYIEIMMRSCIRSSLVLAKHSQLQAIAYPTLTTKMTGETYEETLRMGLRIIAEEAKYSDLTRVHIVAISEREARLLIDMAKELGLPEKPSD